MKLLLLCLIAGYAMAVPATSGSDGDVHEGITPTPYGAEEGDLENGEVASDFFMKEMQDIILANKNRTGSEKERRQTTGCNFRALEQGSTVALQSLYSKRHWLGCSGNTCVRNACPGLYMEGNDWNNCPADVYRIYRMNGPGSVRVGDAIGLYYPPGRNWFSAYGGTGHGASCPGTPTSANGFANEDKWLICFGEVFRIYARGKSSGAVINEHDDIFLFYVNDNKWVGLVGDGAADHRTCPGTARPPPAARYDICWGEVFEIWRR